MNQLNVQLVDLSLSEFYKVRTNYNTDSGYDLYCPETILVPPHSVGTLDFKVRCSLIFKNFLVIIFIPDLLFQKLL